MEDVTYPHKDTKMKAVRGNYAFGPTLLYSEAANRDITNYIHQASVEDEGKSYTIISRQLPIGKAIESDVMKLLQARGGGFVYLSTSLPQDAGLSLSPTYGSKLDAVVISQTDVPYVLTFSTDPDSDATPAYNRKLATLLLRRLRVFVDDDFTFAFGVVEDRKETTKVGFPDCVESLRERSTRFALHRYLTMSPDKCASLTRGLVSMLLVRDQIEGSGDCKSSGPRSIFIDTTQASLGKLICDTR